MNVGINATVAGNNNAEDANPSLSSNPSSTDWVKVALR